MGGGATSVVDIINVSNFNIDQSTRNKIDSDCINNTKQNNMLQIVGSKVENLKVEQQNTVKNLCILQTMIEQTKDASATNELMAKIKEQIEAKGGIPGTAGSANSITNIYNQMNMNLDQSVVNDITKNCILNTKQENVIQIFGSNVKNADLTQVNKAFIECLQNHSEVTNMTAEAANSAKAEIDKSVKSSGINPLDSLASIGQIYGIVVGGIVLVCLGSSAISALSSVGGGGGGSSAPPPMYGPPPSYGPSTSSYGPSSQ
jgi:hypothetical protein